MDEAIPPHGQPSELTHSGVPMIMDGYPGGQLFYFLDGYKLDRFMGLSYQWTGTLSFGKEWVDGEYM